MMQLSPAHAHELVSWLMPRLWPISCARVAPTAMARVLWSWETRQNTWVLDMGQFLRYPCSWRKSPPPPFFWFFWFFWYLDDSRRGVRAQGAYESQSHCRPIEVDFTEISPETIIRYADSSDLYIKKKKKVWSGISALTWSDEHCRASSSLSDRHFSI